MAPRAFIIAKIINSFLLLCMKTNKNRRIGCRVGKSVGLLLDFGFSGVAQLMTGDGLVRVAPNNTYSTPQKIPPSIYK
jgi:hypothetical protein